MGKPSKFVGRAEEIALIQKLANREDAHILTVYGRRRVGKTELIEHTLKSRTLLKLEGIENGDMQMQMDRVLHQLSKRFGDVNIARMQFRSWMALFDFIATKTSTGVWTLYLEELQ